MIYAMANVVARDGEHAATNYETRWGYGLDAIDAKRWPKAASANR